MGATRDVDGLRMYLLKPRPKLSNEIIIYLSTYPSTGFPDPSRKARTSPVLQPLVLTNILEKHTYMSYYYVPTEHMLDTM